MHIFDLAGVSWTMDDYTLREIEQVEEALDCNWGDLYPSGRAQHVLVLLAVFLRRTKTEDEVAELVDGLTLGDLRKRVVTYEQGDDLPNASREGVPLADAQGTTGSSSAPLDSDGLPPSPEPSPSAT